MLVRVSNALTKFISPIADSIGVDDHAGRQKNQEFERYKKGKTGEQENPASGPKSSPGLAPVIPIRKESLEPPPLFIQLFTLIEKTKTRANKFRCSMLYDFSLRNRKKKKVKGSMLDTSI